MNVYFKTYASILELLPSRLRGKFFGLQALILLTSLMDVVGLAAFVPVISLITGDQETSENPKILYLQEVLGIQDDQQFKLTLFLGAFIFFVFRSGFIVYSNWVQAKFSFRMSEMIAKKTYFYYLNSKFEEIKRHVASTLVRELTVSPQHYSKFLMLPLLQLTSEFFVMVLIVVGIAVYDIGIFLMISCTIFPVALAFNILVKKRMKRYGWTQHSLSPRLLDLSLRGLLGYVDVKLRSKESRIVEEYHDTMYKIDEVSIRSNVLGFVPAKLMEVTTVAGLLLIFVYAMYLSGNPDRILPLIAVYAAAGYRIIPSISRVMPSLMHLDKYSYLFDIYRGPMSTTSSTKIPDEETRVTFERMLDLDKVSFGYGNTDNRLFTNLSMSIERGEVVGIIGRSGSGKSSLVNILSGFLRPSSGSVKVDGIELNDSNLRSWMSLLSYVEQQPYIERGSLTLNIAFLDDEVDRERLNNAIENSSLAEYVQGRNPDQIDIEEQGKNLSGGQKQRIAIARALYHNSKIIVLDEATSALDIQTENEINLSIERLKEIGITVVIVAHRYSTLKNTDRIVEMDEGRIVRMTDYESIAKTPS